MQDIHENNTQYLAGLDLADAEIFNLGRIVAYWGCIEHEVFLQAALSLSDEEKLPKKLNNIQFSETLNFWEAWVVEPATGDRKTKLRDSLARIRYYHAYRAGLIHGMWNWDRADPSMITATVVSKDNVSKIQYTARDLADMAFQLASILFDLRHPDGIADHVSDLEESGGYMSRNLFFDQTSHLNSKKSIS